MKIHGGKRGRVPAGRGWRASVLTLGFVAASAGAQTINASPQHGGDPLTTADASGWLRTFSNSTRSDDGPPPTRRARRRTV